MIINILKYLFDIIILIGCVAGGYWVRRYIEKRMLSIAEERAAKILEDAEKEADAKKKEALLEAKDGAYKIRIETEKEIKRSKRDLSKLEERLLKREENLERRINSLERRERDYANKERAINRTRDDLAKLKVEELKRLERISNLTSEEAKELLLNELKSEIKQEACLLIKDAEEKVRNEVDRKSREIIVQAITSCAVDMTVDNTVSSVPLPSEKMKGRIIGRGGRNIRTLEMLTGVDLIIDDTPEAVVLSSFNPLRREIARITLEKLITDGRIHPARIEAMVEKAKSEVNNSIREAGEQALFELKINGVHPELVRLLGRLKFRSSFGQNVLRHSLEVAHLAGVMAAEIGANYNLTKRAGLLHDIGKAIDHEVEGPHAAIGAELARRYKESPGVIHAIAAHHGEVAPETVEAVLVQAADAISASRPGSRREVLEAYIRRLEKLEEIAASFDGIQRSYVIQAGREIRVMVQPEIVDDLGTVSLVRDIVKRVEKELEYPGQVKVTVIRETRAVDYAK